MHETDKELEKPPRALDGLFALQKFPRITDTLPLEAGMKILAHRLGLSGARIQALARERCPAVSVEHEQTHLRKFRIRCFLRFDLVFTDILHTDYEELKYLGLGRRYLMNRILRAVLAGICDGLDPSGVAGDFRPASWETALTVRRMRAVQSYALDLMKHRQANRLQSLKVRLRRIATPVLRALADQIAHIRREVGDATKKDPASGLIRISELLVEFKKSFDRRIRKEDINNRKKARKKRLVLGYKHRSTRRRQKYQMGASLLIRGLTDLRKLLDPDIPSWYRRPTDEDWNEGMRADRRKPRHPCRKTLLGHYGLGAVPGLTEPISAQDWATVRTQWTTAEVRKHFSERQAAS